MEIQAGKTYEVTEENAQFDEGQFFEVLRVHNGRALVMLDAEEVNYHLSVIQEMKLREVELSKPRYYNTTIDTTEFAKMNFPAEQVKGFLRISAIKCLQSNEGYNLESLNKASQYIKELIKMESKQKELHP